MASIKRQIHFRSSHPIFIFQPYIIALYQIDFFIRYLLSFNTSFFFFITPVFRFVCPVPALDGIQSVNLCGWKQALYPLRCNHWPPKILLAFVTSVFVYSRFAIFFPSFSFPCSPSNDCF